jgi:hypothetical protein
MCVYFLLSTCQNILLDESHRVICDKCSVIYILKYDVLLLRKAIKVILEK